jgi:hypothetical protein
MNGALHFLLKAICPALASRKTFGFRKPLLLIVAFTTILALGGCNKGQELDEQECRHLENLFLQINKHPERVNIYGPMLTPDDLHVIAGTKKQGMIYTNRGAVPGWNTEAWCRSTSGYCRATLWVSSDWTQFASDGMQSLHTTSASLIEYLLAQYFLSTLAFIAVCGSIAGVIWLLQDFFSLLRPRGDSHH